jgi:hypothetical protein
MLGWQNNCRPNERNKSDEEIMLGNKISSVDCMCPYCKAKIPLDDVNVANDIALCRACQRTCSFSTASSTSEISPKILDAPPKWVRMETGFNGEATIVYHRLSPMLWFFLPFTVLWSGGSMIGIYGTQIWNGKYDLGQSLFGIPFLFGTIILLTVILYMIFGKWIITLDRGQGKVFVGVGSLGWTREFSYNRDSLVSLKMTSVQVNNVSQKGISIRTDDKDFVFGALMKEEAKRFVAAAILQQVENAK